jgi:hypothetical protein
LAIVAETWDDHQFELCAQLGNAFMGDVHAVSASPACPVATGSVVPNCRAG